MAAVALTLGSVGDIIALCNVARTGIEALSSSRGSVTQYNNLLRELWNLSRALDCVKLLLGQDCVQLQRRGDLEKVVFDRHRHPVRFLERLEAFECLL